MALDPNEERSENLLGRLRMNALSEVYATADITLAGRNDKLLVVSGVYPGNATFTLELG